MVPSMVLRVRRAVRRFAPRPEHLVSTGQENLASWDRMLSRFARIESDAERRLRSVERELNRLGLDEQPNSRETGPPQSAVALRLWP